MEMREEAKAVVGNTEKGFYLEKEAAVSLEKNYILHLTANKLGCESRFGVALSSYQALVYNLGESLTCSCSFPVESSPIINVKFAPTDPALLYVGTAGGTIKLFDLRSPSKPVNEFQDTSKPKSKNLHSKTLCYFDINCDGRFACAGTEVTDGDAFLMFWDTRNSSLLGGYWECHTDDVTQVVFHPTAKDTLMTGSTDGLINIYDVSKQDEDDALEESLNTESSVEKLRWHQRTSGGDTISCITHTADIQLWQVDESSPFMSSSRADVAASLQMGDENLEDTVYVSDIHSTSGHDELLVIAGSNFENGQCLRSAVASSGKLKLHSNFTNNKQIVRCSWFDPVDELLVTGGEAGILSVWKSGNDPNLSSNVSQLKITSKLKENTHKSKVKPY